MFNLFRKKTKVEIMQKKYEQLMKEVHTLSKIDRKQSDEKYAEAQELLKQMDIK